MVGLRAIPAHAIVNGTYDSGNALPFVVHVQGHESGGGCSGVLITPKWVLTAAHCVWGTSNNDLCSFYSDKPGWGDPPVNTWVEIGPNPSTYTQVIDAYTIGGVLDACSAESRALDVALLELADRIPYSAAGRFHPPGIYSAAACPPSGNFDGLMIGYGATSVYGGGGGLRRYNYANGYDGWERIAYGAGVAYETAWPVPIPAGPTPEQGFVQFMPFIDAAYGGMGKGDSGGPLMHVNGNGNPLAICGVASGPWIGDWWPGIKVDVGNTYAAVDTPQAIQLMIDHILYDTPQNPDIDGWYEGECPSPNETADVDTDGDAVPDACDNCPDDWNPGQENGDYFFEGNPLGDACDPCLGENIDSDLDGCDDACDPCPNSSGYGYFGINCGDFDYDGVCDYEDNCTFVENASQQLNANLNSEIAHPVPTPSFLSNTLDPSIPWRPGDACDSVPTPYTETYGVVVPNAPGCLGTKMYDRSQFKIWPRASHPIAFWHTLDPSLDPWPVSAGLLDTPVRFCQDHGDVDCDSDFGIDDVWLDANGCAYFPNCSDPEQPEDYYHRMTFVSGGNGVDPDGPAAALSYDLLVPPWQIPAPTYTAVWHWNYLDDYTRWTQGPGSYFDPSKLPASPSELRGVLWLHAETDVGDTVDVGTGLHGPQLANEHLVDYGPLECGSPMPMPGPLQEVPPIEVRWDPGPGPDPWKRIDQLAHEAELLVRLDPSTLGMLGGGQEASAEPIEQTRVGQAFLSRYGDSNLVQANSVEPAWAQGAGPTFPFVVWLNRIGGEDIVDMATTDGVDLYANADRAVCPGSESMTTAQQEQEALYFEQAALASGQMELLSCAETCASGVCVEGRTLECCTISCSSDFECLTGYCNRGVCDFPRSGGPSVGSPHAVDFVPVLSRIRRGVFVVGGDDVVTGEPTGEIWFAPLNAGGWMPIESTLPPDRVLAATYSWKTRSVYFVDETPLASGGLEARLVEVHVDTASATLLASFPRDPSWDEHHLVLDRDGALLLASSNSAAQEHAVARIDILAAGGPVVDGFDGGSLPLAFAPTVDGVGYTFVLAADISAGIVERVRKRELELAGGGSLASLGAQL